MTTSPLQEEELVWYLHKKKKQTKKKNMNKSKPENSS